jgi:hypothetical protein
MKPALFLLLFAAIFSVAKAEVLKISLRVNKQPTVEIQLKINGDLATATIAGETERFNLKEMSWFNEDTGQWITLDQSKAWAEQSKSKTLKNVDSAPASVRAFLKWSLEPNFKIQKTNDALYLTSGQVDYVIAGEASKENADPYFRYAILNAYKKAMTDKKLPPYSELKAIDEMKTRGCIPKKILVTMPGIAGSPAFEMEIVPGEG